MGAEDAFTAGAPRYYGAYLNQRGFAPDLAAQMMADERTAVGRLNEYLATSEPLEDSPAWRAHQTAQLEARKAADAGRTLDADWSGALDSAYHGIAETIRRHSGSED